MSAQLSTALVPYLGPGDDGATACLRLSPAERRRTAMQAARDHDTAILWSLTEAWLRSFGRVGDPPLFAVIGPGSTLCSTPGPRRAYFTQVPMPPPFSFGNWNAVA